MNYKLLNDCSNTSRSYCTSTLTVWFGCAQELICYSFCRFVTHFMDILPIILSFPGGNVADSYHDNPPFSVHLSNNIAWAKMNVNRDFWQNPGCDTHLSKSTHGRLLCVSLLKSILYHYIFHIFFWSLKFIVLVLPPVLLISSSWPITFTRFAILWPNSVLPLSLTPFSSILSW